MEKRKLLALMGGVCLVLVLVALPFMAASAKPAAIKWKAVEFLPLGDFQMALFEELISRVNQQSKGELTITLAGGPEAIPARDQPRAIMKGVYDIGELTGSAFVPIAPQFYCVSLTDLAPWELREKGWVDVFNEAVCKKVNVFYLGHGMHPQLYALFTSKNKRVGKVADFAGLKLRTAEGQLPFVKALGASPVIMPTAEVYTGLERGVIDGYAGAWTHPIGKERCYEVVKYVYPPFGRANCPVLVNLDSWNRLPKRLQDLLKKLQAELEREFVPHFAGMADKMKDPKYGLEFVEFPPAELKRYLAIYEESGWQWMDKNAPGYDPRLRELGKR